MGELYKFIKPHERIIVGKYHRENRVPGYHMMHDYLRNEDSIALSAFTVHHYMKELNLCSIVRR